MSRFKNNSEYKLQYYDTDCYALSGKNLPDEEMSETEMGKFKVEGIYDRAVFLAPKVYALKNSKEEIIRKRE